MHPVSVAVLLTAVVMAHADQMSDVLHVPPHEQHLYIFDVTSEASVDDLKAALGNFTIDDGFKLIGERRFLFLVSSKDTSALHNLAFPAGCAVTQHAVQHIDQYMNMIGVGGGLQENYAENGSTDTIVFFNDYHREWPETMCPKTYEMLLRNFVQEFKRLHAVTKPRMYLTVASQPDRGMNFFHLEDGMIPKMTKSGNTGYDGCGIAHTTTKRAVRI